MDLPHQSSDTAAGTTGIATRTETAHHRNEVKLRHAPITAAVGAAWDHPRVLLCTLATLLAMPLMVIGLSLGKPSQPVEVHTASASYHQPSPVPVSDHLVTSTTTPRPGTSAGNTSTTAGTSSTSSSSTPPDSSTSSAPTNSTTSNSSVPKPAPTAPPTTAAPKWTPPAPTPAPVWQPPATTAPPTTQASANVEAGVASYYADPHGGCAHQTLPFGTVIHITASNGRTATCVVDDRGPYGAGRILDLDTAIFQQLAPLSQGLVSVTATW